MVFNEKFPPTSFLNTLGSWELLGVPRDERYDRFLPQPPGSEIDLRHQLAVLASRMPWQELEASIVHLFAKAVRAGKNIEDVAELCSACARVNGFFRDN